MRFLVINGPNLNMLGIRQPDLYGKSTYADLVALIKEEAWHLNIDIECYQSNHEGAILDKIHEAYGRVDGLVINPGALTHTSIALYDAIKAVEIPAVEVHITDPDKREDFRRVSFLRAACLATIKGKGFGGYLEAVRFLKDHCATAHSQGKGPR